MGTLSFNILGDINSDRRLHHHHHTNIIEGSSEKVITVSREVFRKKLSFELCLKRQTDFEQMWKWREDTPSRGG